MNPSGSSPATETSNTVGSTNREAIATRAQEIWEKLGRPSDRDVEIWLQAERELQTTKTPAPAQHRAPSPQDTPAPRSAAPAADDGARVEPRPLPPASVASAQPRKGRGSKATPR